MFIRDVFCMCFTRVRIRFVCHMFCWYYCFWYSLGIFYFRLRITYGSVFFCLDAVLSVGSFFLGNIVIVIDIVVWLVDVFVVVVFVFVFALEIRWSQFMYGDGRCFCDCHYLFIHNFYILNVGRFCFSNFDGIA